MELSSKVKHIFCVGSNCTPRKSVCFCKSNEYSRYYTYQVKGLLVIVKNLERANWSAVRPKHVDPLTKNKLVLATSNQAD